jgi:hypothetical protein
MTTMQMLTYASPAILVIGGGLGFINYNRLDNIHKSIVWYLLVMLGIDVAHRVLGQKGNNLELLSFYCLTEILLFLYFYYKFLFMSRHSIILVLGVLAIGYIIWELFTYKEIEAKSFQSYAKVADNFIIIILVLGYFYENIERYKESKWDNFTLNIVILIFFSVTLIFFLPFNFIISGSSGLQFYFWLGILITTVMFYIYLTFSIWQNARSRKKIKP